MADLNFREVRRAVPGGERSAVLMLLHGYGSNELDLVSLAEGVDDRLAVIAVRAPLTLARGAYAWFDLEFTASGSTYEPEDAEAGYEALVGFIRAYKVEHEIADVYLMGFSQGSVLAGVAALLEPELVRGVVGFAGALPPQFVERAASRERLAATAMWLEHGTEDPVQPVAQARARNEIFTRLGVPYVYQEFRAVHTITAEMHAKAVAWLRGRVGEA